ncbi:regulator of G-protein signaling 1-like [Rhinophrynus dorsalis]
MDMMRQLLVEIRELNHRENLSMEKEQRLTEGSTSPTSPSSVTPEPTPKVPRGNDALRRQPVAIYQLIISHSQEREPWALYPGLGCHLPGVPVAAGEHPVAEPGKNPVAVAGEHPVASALVLQAGVILQCSTIKSRNEQLWCFSYKKYSLSVDIPSNSLNKMPGIFFSHSNPNVLKEVENKAEEDMAQKKRHFGMDLKNYLKSMLPHLESSIKSANPGKNKLTPDEIIQWTMSLEKLLSNQAGQIVFRDFLKSEFSEENIEFWLACEDFKTTEASDELRSKAEIIYQEFIQPNANKQINIDFAARNYLTSQLLEPTTTTFNEAQKMIYILMERDSYPRFLKSEIFLKLAERHQGNNMRG